MKSKVLRVLTLLILFNIIMTQFNFIPVIASETSLEFNYQSDKERQPFYNPKYNNYPTKYRRATLGNNAAYCIDYGKSLPNVSSLTYQEDLSAEALAVLVYGYPNNSLGEFGMSGEEEYEVQYLVTQMAFWEVVTKTGENKRGLDFNIDDVIASSGYENIMDEIKSAARNLADAAMQNPYVPEPRIAIDTTNYNIVESGDLVVAGPYKITGYDGGTKTDFTVHNIKATLSKSAPSSSYVADKSLNPKTDASLGDEVYVVTKKSETQVNFNLNIEASGDKLKCASYGASGSSSFQNFATIVTEPVNVSQSVNITWKKDTGNITIVKEDQLGNKIKDVRFEILNSTSNKVAEVTTNASGKVELINVPTGQYYIKEISAPIGYVINNAIQSVVVTSGNTSIVNVSNTKSTGILKVVKKDENNDPIENVKFKILDSNKNNVQTIVTDNLGIAQSQTLNVGTYYLIETDVPNNVILDTTEHKFDITSYNQVVTLPLVNALVKGSLKITKTDEYGNSLSGVKFEIYDQNNKKLETITTNNSGIAVSKVLSPGQYSYKEVSTKDPNLIVDDTYKQFTINNSGNIVAVKEVNKYKKGNVKILKIDQNNNPIEGVTFEIYNSNKELVDTIITDKNGVAMGHKNMVLGTYSYKEISAPSNVEMNTQEKTFELKTDGQIVEISVQNKLIEGKIKISKLDENNNPIKDVQFEILDSNKQVIQTLTTDDLGICISSQLSTGKYYYKEKTTLSQYVLDNTEHEFEIKNANDFVEVSVVNKLKSAKLILNKLNKDTGVPLQNIRFEILDSNKNVIASVVTNENGIAETDNLKVGTYYYKEVSVPENIAIDNNEYEFKIQDQDVNVEKTVYNVQKRLPVTGSLFSTNVIIVIVVTLSCTLLYIFIKMIIAYIQNKNNNW